MEWPYFFKFGAPLHWKDPFFVITLLMSSYHYPTWDPSSFPTLERAIKNASKPGVVSARNRRLPGGSSDISCRIPGKKRHQMTWNRTKIRQTQSQFDVLSALSPGWRRKLRLRVLNSVHPQLTTCRVLVETFHPRLGRGRKGKIWTHHTAYSNVAVVIFVDVCDAVFWCNFHDLKICLLNCLAFGSRLPN